MYETFNLPVPQRFLPNSGEVVNSTEGLGSYFQQLHDGYELRRVG